MYESVCRAQEFCLKYLLASRFTMGKPPSLNKGRHGHFKKSSGGKPGKPKKAVSMLGGVKVLKKATNKRKEKVAARRIAFDRKDAEAELARLGISKEEVADVIMRDAAAAPAKDAKAAKKGSKGK